MPMDGIAAWASVFYSTKRSGSERHMAGGPDIDDARGENGTLIVGMAKFEVHPAADESMFQHRPAPRGPMDRNKHGFGTEHRVAMQQRIALAATDQRVDPILGFDFYNRSPREIVHRNATFDLGLDNGAVDLVAQVRIWRKHRGNGRVDVGHIHTIRFYQ